MAEKWDWMKNYLYNEEEDIKLPAGWPNIANDDTVDTNDPLWKSWNDARLGFERVMSSAASCSSRDTAQNSFSIFKNICQSVPDKPALVWLDGQGNTECQWTYGEFLEKIRSVCYAVVGKEIKQGDRVICCFPPGLDFFAGFWACLALGIVAVPVCPPDPFNTSSDLGKKFAGIIQDCNPTLILTNSLYIKAIEAGRMFNEGISALDIFDTEQEWLPVDSLPPITKDKWDFQHQGDVTDLAFLQYTSGSTGSPKGVMVTHDNLLRNVYNCLDMTNSTDSFTIYKYTVTVSWLPSFHDMGLIGFHIALMSTGATVIGFSPIDFIQNPILWLKVISRYKRVVTGAPPFALELCARKVTALEKETIDLRRLAGIVIGAEPIRKKSLQDFAERFADTGFNRQTFLPCYGLAENVLYTLGKRADWKAHHELYVCSKGLSRGELSLLEDHEDHEDDEEGELGETKGTWLVSSGEQAGGESGNINASTVLIVDPATCVECADGTVGEVWVTGPCKTAGYWNRAQETEEVFGAELLEAVKDGSQRYVRCEDQAHDSSEHRAQDHSDTVTFIRTGDMGAILDKQLFITGRYKDCIILNGANYYPHDIEDRVKTTCSGLKPGAIVAVAVKDQDGIERLMVLAEVRDKTRGQRSRGASPLYDAVYQMSITFVNAMPTSTLLGFYKVYLMLRRTCRSKRRQRRQQSQQSQQTTTLQECPQSEPQSEAQSEAAKQVASQYNQDERKALLRSVRKAVLSHFGGVAVHTVVLLAPSSIRKTSSGKLRRVATKDAWLAGDLRQHTLAVFRAGQKAAGMLQATASLHERPDDPIRPTDAIATGAIPTGATATGATATGATATGVPVVLADVNNTHEAVQKRIIELVLSVLGEELDETVKSALKAGDIDADETLDEYGLDSLTATKLAASLTSAFELATPLSVFMFITEPTLNGVTKVVVRMRHEQTHGVQRTPLSPTGVTKAPPKTGRLAFKVTSYMPHILGIGCAVPALGGPQRLILAEMKERMQLPERRAKQFDKIGKGAKVEQRHTVFEDAHDMFWGKRGEGNDAGMDVRNAKYKEEAPKLAVAAARKALEDWGGNKEDITHVVAVTCTGVLIPGLEFHVMSGLGLSRNVQRLSITFMGCFGALAGLKAARALACSSRSNRVLVVCCELCSLHMQLSHDVDNLVASTIFSDGAGSFVVGAFPSPDESPIFQLHHDASEIIPNTENMMAWELSDTGFVIGLHKDIPSQIYKHIKPFCDRLLSVTNTYGDHQLDVQDCQWAIHPGGPMIIQAICDVVGVTEPQSEEVWEVLRNYGNMSSATLVFVWDHIRRKKLKHAWVPSLAFGPGLNVEGALLRACC